MTAYRCPLKLQWIISLGGIDHYITPGVCILLLQSIIKPVWSEQLTETSRGGLEECLAQDGDKSHVARDACPGGDQIHIGSGTSTDEQDEITFNLEKGLSRLSTHPCEDGGAIV